LEDGFAESLLLASHALSAGAQQRLGGQRTGLDRCNCNKHTTNRKRFDKELDIYRQIPHLTHIRLGRQDWDNLMDDSDAAVLNNAAYRSSDKRGDEDDAFKGPAGNIGITSH
jgi:hypothetical protein